jgi:hypothetical protein
MNKANHTVDEAITLERVNPPTYNGTTLRWSGEGDEPGQPGRIPEPGEAVLWEKGPFAVVETYFQDHGFLGVKVRLDSTGEVVSLFGFEIEVALSSPNKVVLTHRADTAGVFEWVN